MGELGALQLIQQEIAAAAAFKISVCPGDRARHEAGDESRDLVSKGLSPDYKWELRRLLLNIRSITEAVAFDLNGATRAEASRFRPFFPEGPGPPPSTALEKVREGKTYFGPVSFTRGYGPYLIIAVPIERFAGELIGILQARIDLKYVGETLSSLRVGKAGHVHLVTGSGLLIGHPDLSVVLQKRNLAKLEQTQTVFRSVSDVTTPNTFATRNMHEQRVLTSYALIPSVGWAVVAEQPIEEVYTPLYASLLRTSVVLLIGLGVALMATLFVSRRVVRPLETLRQGVESIGRGNLSVRLNVKTGDELEILADEINEMTAHLREATGLGQGGRADQAPTIKRAPEASSTSLNFSPTSTTSCAPR
jgi:HAMP domain-containing protein